MATRIVIFGWAESVHIKRWTSGLRDRGFDIKLVSLGGAPLRDIPTTVFPRTGRTSYARYASAAAEAARSFYPDIVHVHYAGGFGHWGVQSGIRPMVVSVWGSEIERISKKFWVRPIIRRTMRAATAITATSEYLLDQTGVRFPEVKAKCSLIPWGVAAPGSVPSLPAAPPLKLCFLKMHRDVYGPDVLLQALARVVADGVDVTLTMAGEGELTGMLQRMAADLKLSGRIRFTGLVPHEDIPALLANHHALVMPSRAEAFGVAALEAGSYGRPTIATNVGGIPEVIVDGETGILVPPDDVGALAEAIIRLAGDPSLMRRMGEAASGVVREKFSWQHSLDLMCELYSRVLAEKK